MARTFPREALGRPRTSSRHPGARFWIDFGLILHVKNVQKMTKDVTETSQRLSKNLERNMTLIKSMTNGTVHTNQQNRETNDLRPIFWYLWVPGGVSGRFGSFPEPLDFFMNVQLRLKMRSDGPPGGPGEASDVLYTPPNTILGQHRFSEVSRDFQRFSGFQRFSAKGKRNIRIVKYAFS